MLILISMQKHQIVNQMKEFNFQKYTNLFIFSFTILPFLILCFYNVPLGDDFWYADKFRTYGFVETQQVFFQKWSGRYIATALISGLNPISYGYFNLSFIHPLLLILGFAWSLKILINNCVEFFKLSINSTLLFCLILFFYFNYLPDFGETFYWMAGAYTYQLPIIFFLLYLNSLLHLFKSNLKFTMLKNQIFAIICLIIILGCNEVIVVYTNFVNGLLILFLIKNKSYLNRFTPLFIIALAISVFMITAPGNFGRAELFEKSDFHLLKVCLHSLSRSLFVIVFWLTSLFLILINYPNLFLIKESKIESMFIFFKRNNWFLISSFGFLLGLLFVGFFPSIYTTNWIPQRAYTPIFFTFTIFSTILIFIAIRKIKVLNELNKILSAKSVGLVLLPIIIVALAHNSNVMNAYVDITSGKASSFKKQVLVTYEELSNTKNDTVFVNQIAKRPIILPYRWPGENRLVNGEWEKYFKIKRVELKSKTK